MTITVIKVISVVVALVGATFIIPITSAVLCNETWVIKSFAVPMMIAIIIALLFLYFARNNKTSLSIRGSFVVVALAWLAASIMGAIPLYFTGACPTVTNAVFESISGFSTTGATNISDLDSLPRTINLWRCQMHWLGGMGIVALSVALLPILGVGGFQLIKAETTGPDKSKFTPKITTTAKVLWFIYLGMTIVHAVLLKFAGMDTLDAISHAFSSMGTGGFSTKNDNIGFWHSAKIEAICSVFMLLSGINFTLYYYLFTKKFAEIKKDTELRVYIGIIIVVSICITFFERNTYSSIFTSIRYSVFQIISIITTTGYTTSDYTQWTSASQCMIFLLFFIGGCAGSTAGGFKIIRWTVFSKQLHNEIQRMLHPHGIFTIRINSMPGRKDVVFNVAAFLYIYLLMILIVTFGACIFGVDIFTSLTGALSVISNVGPAFNKLGPSVNCASLPDQVKWIYSFAMLAGRLEFYTMIIYFFPSYWEK